MRQSGLVGEHRDVQNKQSDQARGAKALANFFGPARDLLNRFQVPDGCHRAEAWSLDDLIEALYLAERCSAPSRLVSPAILLDPLSTDPRVAQPSR
jgi:hypothetical protein